MSDNAGNIIYLVAVIVAVLSSILSKAKKSRIDDSPAPSTPTRSWQDVIREITREEEAPQPAVLPEQRQHVFEKMQPHPFLDEEKKLHKDTLVKEPQAPRPMVNVAEEPVASVTLPDFSNLDELKRGIVFSEIFHRKF
jgi:hypothetical protein